MSTMSFRAGSGVLPAKAIVSPSGRPRKFISQQLWFLEV